MFKTLHIYRSIVKASGLRILISAVLPLCFVSAASGQMIQIVSPANNSVSEYNSQTITAKGWAGFNAELWVDNKLAQKGTVRIDGIIDFINVQVPSGNRKFETRLVNPDGSVIDADSIALHILGGPAALSIELADSTLRANGASSTKGKVRVFDAWGFPLQQNIVVTVSAENGKILTDDIDPQTPGTQIQLIRGVAQFEYQAGRTTGQAMITAQTEQAKAESALSLAMPLEPLTVVGLINGSAAGMSESGDRSGLADPSSFAKGLTMDGRAAVYARGSFGDDYLITGSYDSDRRNRSSLFRTLDPDYLYSIYGDNSLLTYDAQTQSPLYIKIEKNRDYLLYGDFNTDLSSQEFTLYNRSLTGVKAEHQDDNWKVKVFGALTDHKVVHTEIRGEGLSGFYNLGSTQIVVGSEKVSIEVRDKNHSEIIINSTDNFRFNDYDIDYDQGTVFFKQPVPALDPNNNPVWIVVTFEAVTASASTYVAGANVERRIDNHLSIGITGVTEEQSPTNYTLFGLNSKYQLNDAVLVSGEFARSNDFAEETGGKSTGDAYKVEAAVSPFAQLSMHTYYRRMEEGFYNIRESSSRIERGTVKYGVGGNYKIGSSTDITADYYETYQDAAYGVSDLTSLSGGVTHHFGSRLTAQAHVTNLQSYTPDSVAGTMQRSTLLTAGASYVAGDAVKITAQHEQNLGSTPDAASPTADAIIAETKIAKDISANIEERLDEGGGNLTTVGLATNVMEGMQAYSKYEIGDAAGAYRNMISVGLKNKIKLPYDLTANLSYERTKDLNQRVDETSTNDHDAYSVGLEYLPKDPFKASTKIEFGSDNTSKKMNYTFDADYRFKKDLSAILKYTLSEDNAVASSGYRTMSHWIAGLAYRPVESNDFNILGKFEVKQDDNHYVSPYDDYQAMIGSVHAYFEPVRRFELGLKFAYKVAFDGSDDYSVTTHSSFYLARGTYDINEKMDVAAEFRTLMQVEANDMLYGYSAEVGYVVIKNLRLAAGYNFKGYVERDLVDNNLWSAGPFLKFSFKFGEDLFGK